MKFLSLISGKSVHIAPGVKVLPGKEVSTLVEAEQVLEEVKQEAIEYRKKLAKEGEELKAQAKQQGFEEGLKEWAEQMELLEKEIGAVRSDMEKLITSVALKSAKKILGREIELNRTTIVDIVANNLKSVYQHRKIVLYVNKTDLDVLEEHKAELKKVLELASSFSIQVRDDVSPHGVIIETEAGIINAQIENLWHTLEVALQSLTSKK